jgi:hypothetical protein
VSLLIPLVIAVLAGALVGGVLMWASVLSPTRPRPKSRYRGETFTTVDRKLRQRKRR